MINNMIESQNECVIFFLNNMLVGGIETYVYRAIKQLKKQNIKIIWVKSKRARIDSSFTEELYDGNVIIWNDKIHYKELRGLFSQSSNVHITIVTFDLYNFSSAEKIKKRTSWCRVDTFYFVPHFSGQTLYLEEAYTGKKKEKVQQKTSVIINKMHNNKNIRCFSDRHINELITRYGITVNSNDDMKVPNVLTHESVDINRLQRIARRKRFNILSVSRFEFPHKGFLLGLIKAYAHLKEKYPQIELTIVGYGDGLKDIQNVIEVLPEYVSKDIHLVGRIAPDLLKNYYDDANLNISAAGSCTQGARRGVLSLPVRHYCYDCEVYGFIPDSISKVLSSDPGMPVEDYIEMAIQMPESEYISRCLASADAYPRREVLWDTCKLMNSDHSTLSNKEIIYIRTEYYKYIFKLAIKSYMMVFSKEGLIKPVRRRILKKLGLYKE